MPMLYTGGGSSRVECNMPITIGEPTEMFFFNAFSCLNVGQEKHVSPGFLFECGPRVPAF